MTARIPWTRGLIAGACFAVTACSGQSDASVATTGTTAWVCDTRPEPDTGQCASIVVKAAHPDSELEVRHFVKNAEFVITYDGTDYGVSYKTKEWLPSFLGAAPLTWTEGQAVLDYGNCKSGFAAQMHATAVVNGRTIPKYSQFSSKKIPLHLKEKDLTGVELHTWYILPLQGGPEGKTAYCLKLKDENPDGGSHDGAVHAEN